MIPGLLLSNCVLAAWFGVVKRLAYQQEESQRLPSLYIVCFM